MFITTRCSNGELKPATTEQFIYEPHALPLAKYAMSAQRLSLIYLVKERSGRENQNAAYFSRANRLRSDLSDATPAIPDNGGGAMRDRTGRPSVADRLMSALMDHVVPDASYSLQLWWSYAGSNRRPPACKAGALPAEL